MSAQQHLDSGLAKEPEREHFGQTVTEVHAVSQRDHPFEVWKKLAQISVVQLEECVFRPGER